jgi:serine/threonine-protein kinase
MLPPSPEKQAVQECLERVLGSAGFTRNERLSGFLRFVVARTLEGKDSELKESVIAVEVFGRRTDYDPKLDSIVRTEAGRLRARLTEYYSGEGSSDPVVIELPKGGYVPLFRQKDAVQAQLPEERQKEAGEQSTPVQARRWLAIAAAVFLCVLAAGGGWWWHRGKTEPITIAVLPLKSLSPDGANDYFADGLTDEIISNLSVIDGLAVRSHTSSFAFKGTPVNIRDAARQLNVDYILEGSVLREGSRLRINAQLVRVRDDVPLWSDEYDREMTDVFAIQDDISRGIVNGLRLKFGRGRRRYETSLEAYDLYLRARALPIQRGIMLGYAQSFSLFEQAIAKDPSFAPAYAGLASAYATDSAGGAAAPAGEGLAQAEKLARMRTAAEKAIQLDPLLAEAHEALGMANARDGQLEQSEKSFRRAIELDPNLSIAHDEFAMDLLLPLDRIEEALHEVRVAETSDPLSPTTQAMLAYVLISAGQYDEAAERCQKLPADYRQKSQCLGRARLGQGRIDEAIQVLTAADEPGYLGYAYGRAGRREEAEELAAASRDNFDKVLIFAGLGDKDRTLQFLDRMTRLGPFRVGRMLTFPELALLRGDPRVKDLRRKAGLPD